MLKWLTTRKESRRTAEGLYAAIVAQSRLPAFYSEFGVPDTVTGRFEMIVLHMFLVLERLQSGSHDDVESNAGLGQALNEAFVANMDDAMREMGVADVRVGERMHQAAGAYFGRLMAYRKAFENVSSGDTDAADPLAGALRRNVLAESAVDDPTLADAASSLATYARSTASHLSGIPLPELRFGMVSFPSPVR